MGAGAVTAPTRPVVRYHGGKWLLAPWIIDHFPKHRTYVEPFGGGGSVLLRKARSYAEVYNDLDSEIVNVFRVLREPWQAARLLESIELTPFSRAEFENAYQPAHSNIERARRAIVRSMMGFGSAAFNTSHATGFRSNSTRSGTTPAMDWRNYPAQIFAFVDRLRGVVVENRDARDVMRQHDGPETLHYVDPPYPHSTRSSARGVRQKYREEMTDDEHRSLAECLHGLRGMVVLSGYPCPLYDEELYASWERVEREALADGARRRVEVLWLSPATSAALRAERAQLDLVEGLP